MTAATYRTSRMIGFTFAVLMATIINGSVLVGFDHVATKAAAAQSAENRNVAVLDTVTIVGHRI